MSRGDRFASTLDGVDRRLSSPNHGPRLGPLSWPDAVVLHYTGMRDGPSATAWLCNPASGVSAHYVVTEAGEILQLVDERRRAWHAGRSSWNAVTDMNSASIGIEIINGGHDFGLPEFPPDQIEAVTRLCADIIDRHQIPPRRVLAHSDVAPARKRDPGERFPWRRLAKARVGLWAEPSGRDIFGTLGPGHAGDAVLDLQIALARFGYGCEPTGVYDAATETIVRAFQRHYRATVVDGVADPATQTMLSALLSLQD